MVSVGDPEGVLEGVADEVLVSVGVDVGVLVGTTVLVVVATGWKMGDRAYYRICGRPCVQRPAVYESAGESMSLPVFQPRCQSLNPNRRQFLNQVHRFL